MSIYMGQTMAECDCTCPACEPRGYCMAARIEELEAKLAKAMELVERAFNEGFGSGMDDVLKSSGGRTWYDSRSRKRLTELTGGKDE